MTTQELLDRAQSIINEIRSDAITPARLGELVRDMITIASKGDSDIQDLFASMIYNVSQATDNYALTPTTARAAVPTKRRKKGSILSYKTPTGDVLEMFTGSDLSLWTNENSWTGFGTKADVKRLEEKSAEIEKEKADLISKYPSEEPAEYKGAINAKDQYNFNKEFKNDISSLKQVSIRLEDYVRNYDAYSYNTRSQNDGTLDLYFKNFKKYKFYKNGIIGDEFEIVIVLTSSSIKSTSSITIAYRSGIFGIAPNAIPYTINCFDGVAVIKLQGTLITTIHPTTPLHYDIRFSGLQAVRDIISSCNIVFAYGNMYNTSCQQKITSSSGYTDCQLLSWGNPKYIAKSDNIIYNINTYSPADSIPYTPYLQKQSPRPICTIVSDDGNIEDYTILRPIMCTRNVEWSLAIPSGQISVCADGNARAQMTLREIQELVLDGCSVSSHNITQEDYSTLNDLESDRVMRLSRNQLFAQGLRAMHLSLPYGRTNAYINSNFRKYYISKSTTNPGINNRDRTDKHTIDRVELRRFDTATLKSYVDQCVSNNAWLVIYIHGYEVYIDGYIDKLIDIIDYAKSAGCAMLNYDDAYVEMYGLGLI